MNRPQRMTVELTDRERLVIIHALRIAEMGMAAAIAEHIADRLEALDARSPNHTV